MSSGQVPWLEHWRPAGKFSFFFLMLPFTFRPPCARPMPAFFLFHAHQRGSIYSLDEGRRDSWSKPLREHIDKLQRGKGESGKKYSYRLVGSAVADVHRTLVSRALSRDRPPAAQTGGLISVCVLMRGA